ncbi:Survival motor neuron protein 1 [Orchesella cincta]|uniref:Survival motor neuron protein 1 n=1 Tax=Orchesella cincta TaxID=48709 RepID=A0A1D2NIC3_ORCCI|nr:Survival motor neuron protein 1 [Orchesella cincta]
MATSHNSASLMESEDAWDDRELIRAYDKAVKNWRRNRDTDAATKSETETPGPGPWVEVPGRAANSGSRNLSNDRVVERNLKIAEFQTHLSHPITQPVSVEGGFPYSAEATVDSSSEISSVEEEPEEVEDVQDYTSVEGESSYPQYRFPVPPMPLSFSKKDGSFDFGRGELPALLMSWYMAGYQAGFYDAKQEFKSGKRSDTKKAPEMSSAAHVKSQKGKK